jgi:hypothetical protein
MEDIIALKQAQLSIELSPNTAHFTVESALHQNSTGTTIVKLRYAIRPLVIDANLSEADRNRNNSGRNDSYIELLLEWRSLSFGRKSSRKSWKEGNPNGL